MKARDSKGRFVKSVSITPAVPVARMLQNARFDSRSSVQTTFVPKRKRKSNGPVTIFMV